MPKTKISTLTQADKNHIKNLLKVLTRATIKEIEITEMVVLMHSYEKLQKLSSQDDIKVIEKK